MINKKYYCNNCDKCISNKNSPNKTKLNTQLSLSVVNNYNNNDIPINEIDNTINKYVYDYNKKVIDFVCWCNIQNNRFYEKINMGWMDESNIEVQEKIIRKHNCKQDGDVCIEFWFITDLFYATYNHYFQLSKPMIERKSCQIIDRNPNLIKILNKMPEPYKRHIVTKQRCFQHEDRFGTIRIFLPAICMELEPNIIT